MGESVPHQSEGGRHAARSLHGIAHRWTRRLSVAGLLTIGTGCAIALGRVPMVSTRTVTATDLVRPPMLTRTTRGRACTWIALVVPVTPLTRFGEAIDDALAGTSAAALWDVRISYELIYLPPGVGRGCYVVEGRIP
jgi:hypothetical protein